MNITSRFKALLLIGGMLFCVFASAEQVVSHTGSVDMTEQTTTGSLENDIFFKADFDGDMLFIAGEGIECKLPEDGCCPGKFGRGYHFQRISRNILPPEIANVEKMSDKFEGLDGTKVTLVNEDSPIGKTALSVIGKGFRITPLKTEQMSLIRTQINGVIASCFIKGPEGAEVTMEFRLHKYSADEKEILTKLGYFRSASEKYKAGLLPDKSGIESIKLTGQWQRIATYAEYDARTGTMEPRVAELIFNFNNTENNAIFLNGFQLEQIPVVIPYFYPTSWMPGKTTRPAEAGRIELTGIDSKRFSEKFPVKSGAVSFWLNQVADCNLPYQSLYDFFNFSGKEQPAAWFFAESKFAAGGKAESTGIKLPVNSWAHVVVSWDEKTVGYYLNGRKVISRERELSAIPGLDEYAFNIGGPISSASRVVNLCEFSCNRKMDEFIIFNRALTGEDVKILHERKGALNPPTGKLVGSPLQNNIFFRNDPNAAISMKLFSAERQSVKLAWGISDFPEEKIDLNLERGVNDLNIKFKPYLYNTGLYELHFAFYGEQGKNLLWKKESINVKKQLRRDAVKFLGWSGAGQIPPDYVKQLGLNQLSAKTPEEMAKLANAELMGNWYFRNIESFKANNYSRKHMERSAQPKIEAMKRYFNWTSTLVNTEVCDEGKMKYLKDDPQLMQAAIDELGFAPPFDEIKFTPVRCSWSGDFEKDGNGVYTPGKAFKALWWYGNEGMAEIKLNSMDVKMLRDAEPGNLLWTEPVDRAGYLMFKDFDVASSWTYEPACSAVFGRLRNLYSVAKVSGKPFTPTLGMPLYHNTFLKCKINDKELKVTATVTDLLAKTWMAIGGIPSHDINFWEANAWYDGENSRTNYIAEENSARRFGEFVRKDLYPAAALLRDMPLAQAKVGLLLPESTRWYSDTGDWSYWKQQFLWTACLAQNQMPFDVLHEIDATEENLGKYVVIIFPMANAVSRNVYNALQKVADKTTIVVDKHCRQNYQNMKCLDWKYTSDMGYKPDPFKPCSDYVKQLYNELKETLDVRAEGAAGPVMAFERGYCGQKYIVVVNNHWTTGELSEHVSNKEELCGMEFKPYGVAQKAKVSVKNYSDEVIYDFLNSRRITGKKEGERLELELDLPPGGARVLCFYPHEFKEMTVSRDGDFKPGGQGVLAINLTDSSGKSPGGRQVLEVEIADPSGKISEESGLYVMENGKAVVPMLFALRAPAGQWTLKLREHSSGLEKSTSFAVNSP